MNSPHLLASFTSTFLFILSRLFSSAQCHFSISRCRILSSFALLLVAFSSFRSISFQSLFLCLSSFLDFFSNIISHFSLSPSLLLWRALCSSLLIISSLMYLFFTSSALMVAGGPVCFGLLFLTLLGALGTEGVLPQAIR